MKRIFVSIIILFAVSFMVAETVNVSGVQDFTVEVLRSDDMSTVIEYQIGSFERELIDIAGDAFFKLHLGREGFLLNEGKPELPFVARSIVIPDRAEKDVFIIEGDYIEFDMAIVPSKGNLLRNQDPETIPYIFSDSYQSNEFYPNTLAELDQPYILRDFRGQTVRVFPFQYNPVENKLRVYSRLLIEVKTVGSSNVNVIENQRNGYSREFSSIYNRRFINFTNLRYTPLQEQGRIIVIAHDSFLEAMQPYVDWKIQKGIRTDMYPISTIGSTPTAIKTFIQAEYDLNDGLTFVQLVGDAAQIPTFMVGGGGSDPSFSLLAGGDNYPDIFVGRFSAENVAQVATQVERTIAYERDMTDVDDSFNKAMGVASNEGSNPSDIQHLNGIRARLLAYLYVEVDQFYAPSATATMVTNALNTGRGFANYTGHGSNTSWSTTGFSNTHVNALTNDYKLPFIVSVACVNGNFTSTTCFAEAWLRATNGTTGAPTGAVAMYASTVNQSWYPPLTAQDEITDLMVEEEMNTIGGLFYNGSSQMMDVWGANGVSEFKAWHIFGDASLQVRSDAATEINVSYQPETFIGLDFFELTTDSADLLVALTYDGEILASGNTGTDGSVVLNYANPPLEPMIMTLTITGYNKVTYVSEVNVIPSDGPYVVINQVNVIGSGANNSVIYGDEVTINIRLRNVGIEDAEMVTATLTTQDPYVTIIDNYEEFGNIVPDGIILRNDAFSLLISESVPDQHRAYLNLEIVDSNDGNWNSAFNFLIHAPEYVAGGYTINDSDQGNNNGFLDPGETVLITIPVSNTGNAVSPLTSVILVTGSDEITLVSDPILDLGAMNPDETINAVFTIAASEEIDLGSVYTLGLLISGGAYDYQVSYALSVGPVIEDFEAGDFSSHTWSFSGTQPWIIVTNPVYEGTYAVKSGTITHSQSSTMSITMDVVSDGNISFYRRVSSEGNYDFLRFFINDQMVGQWSGEVAWSQVTYPVAAGTNTFTWTYIKDFTVSSGSDCAWVDYIEFPSAGAIQGGPVFLANPVNIDFDVVLVDEIAYKSFWIRNFGDEELSGTIETYECFEIEAFNPDVLAGREVLRNGRTVYNYQIPPLSNIEFNLMFIPAEAMDYSGELLITSNAGNMPETTIDVVAAGFFLLPAENLSGSVTNEYIILTWDAPVIEFVSRSNTRKAFNRNYAGERVVEILGYNIYKNGTRINDEPITEEVYHDEDIVVYETYTYAITVVYNLGESGLSDEIEVYVTSADEEDFYVPIVTELRENYPNPFNPSTRITYSLKEQSHVQLEIYNILGQRVKRLVNEVKASGVHSVIWDGSNETGAKTASGIYFYRMQTDSYNRTRKMIYMK